MDKNAERDRILVEDDDPATGFALVADLKWNQKLTEELYVLAICRRRGLQTLRDLHQGHVPLLRNILDKSLVRTIKNSSVSCNDSWLAMSLAYDHFNWFNCLLISRK